MDILPFISLAVGIAGFVFGVWRHFATRKRADLRYELSQLADYKMPGEFLHEVSRAPIKIRVISVGNKSAQNIAVRIKTRFPIATCQPDPLELKPEISDNLIRAQLDQLNPRQELTLFVTCNGDPALEQVEAIQITHTEGLAYPMTLNTYSE